MKQSEVVRKLLEKWQEPLLEASYESEEEFLEEGTADEVELYKAAKDLIDELEESEHDAE